MKPVKNLLRKKLSTQYLRLFKLSKEGEDKNINLFFNYRTTGEDCVDEIVAVICDGIDGTCVLATKQDFSEKHLLIRERVGRHNLPTKNLRGQLVKEKYSGWTDDQTLIITDLTRSNLMKAKRQGFNIPIELLPAKNKKKKTSRIQPQILISFSEDRYQVMDDIRKFLKFGKKEWQILLHALSKTDNGWLQYMTGDITIRFAKIVDIDTLKLTIEQGKFSCSKTFTYEYDLKEFR